MMMRLKPPTFLVLVIMAAQPAFALEPLREFLTAGRKHAMLNRIALADSQLSEARKDEAFWTLFPTLNASLGYTYNSNEAVVSANVDGFYQNVVISPHNQLDASAGIKVPVFDLTALYKFRAAKAGLSQAQIQEQVAAEQVDLQVAKAYYLYQAGQAASAVNARHIETARLLSSLASQRAASGGTEPLEVERALVELENLKQNQRENQMAVKAAQRALKTLTDLLAIGGSLEIPAVLPAEEPLALWEAQAPLMAATRSAQSAAAAADASVAAAKAAYLPKLTVLANDHLSNSTGFGSSPNVFTFGVTASLKYDFTILAAVRIAEANSLMAQLKVEDACENANDMIVAAWNQVTLQRSGFEAIRLGSAVQRQNMELAYSRYVAGVASQEELLRSQRELLSAELLETRAYAEYSYDRVLLRILAGKDLTQKGSDGSLF